MSDMQRLPKVQVACSYCGALVTIPDGEETAVCFFCKREAKRQTVVDCTELNRVINEGNRLCNEMRGDLNV